MKITIEVTGVYIKAGDRACRPQLDYAPKSRSDESSRETGSIHIPIVCGVVSASFPTAEQGPFRTKLALETRGRLVTRADQAGKVVNRNAGTPVPRLEVDGKLLQRTRRTRR